jgi:glycerol-3-phosphate dehydrogenase
MAQANVGDVPARRDAARVLIIGGGGTGAALAHDLVLRGVDVTLVERGDLASGTTGRHHGILHSGARYAVADPDAAATCSQEHRILRRIAPGSFDSNGALFVATDDDDPAYAEAFLAACEECGIPTRQLTARKVLRMERGLNARVRSAVLVPDAVVDALELPLRFAATARRNGAALRTHTEVTALEVTGGRVSGAEVLEHRTGQTTTIGADVVVNAAGPWAPRVAAMAGVTVPVHPVAGVLLALGGRLCNRIVHHLHPPGDGDAVVPHAGMSVVGTNSWAADDPDGLDVPIQHIQTVIREASKLLPAVAKAPWRAAWAAARPLIDEGDAAAGGREPSRAFRCFDHAADGVEGLVTIGGGKATTLRAMAETTADTVCAKLGVSAPCVTRDRELEPYSRSA